MFGGNFYDRRFYFITSLAGLVIFYSFNNICCWYRDIYNHHNNKFIKILDVASHLLFYKTYNLSAQNPTT
mgnify:FL=1